MHLLIYYSFRLCEYDITPVNERFQSYLYGTFFTLYLVALLTLVIACKAKGYIHLINLFLLILADIMVIVWQFRHKEDFNKEKGEDKKQLINVKKAAGYFLFFASLSLWFTGVGTLINDIFQKDVIPLIKPDI